MREPMLPVSLLAILLLPIAAWGDHLQDGLDAYDVGDYETALAVCTPFAEAGDKDGQFCIGRLYANGFGVPMDDAQAHKWYGLAAGQGHSEAQFNLAVMHANGWGVPMDDAAAADWYRQSAEGGFTQAQTALAALCHSGRGVEQDFVEAYMWFAVAAGLGDLSAEFKRDEVAAELSPDDLSRGQQLAEAWLRDHEVDDVHAGRTD